jgi:hypothetical protein
VEAIQLVLGPYRDVLQFNPEFPLGSEPLRIDVVIIKKTQDVAIDRAIATIFKSVNLAEYKSPTDHLSVADVYKVYGYACLYTSEEKVDITDATITFVGSRYPRKLLSHLKKVRGYAVEERSPGIYSVVGDILPIQIIDSRELSEDENIWLKGLDNRLDVGQVNQFLAEIERLGKAMRVATYFDVISRANAESMEEATAMGRKRIPTFEEVWASTGLVEKYEARGRHEGLEQGHEEGKEAKAVEVARNLITRIGLPLEQVADATGLDLATVRSLAQTSH